MKDEEMAEESFMCKKVLYKWETDKRSYIDGFKDGYNKANEWHYVKDGDLPPLNINVLVIHKWSRTPEVGKRITVFTNSSEWVWAMCCDRYRYTSDDKNVISWCELPTFDKE